MALQFKEASGILRHGLVSSSVRCYKACYKVLFRSVRNPVNILKEASSHLTEIHAFFERACPRILYQGPCNSKESAAVLEFQAAISLYYPAAVDNFRCCCKAGSQQEAKSARAAMSSR